jgi:thiol-disulfide isomerase/thioredoxin
MSQEQSHQPSAISHQLRRFVGAAALLAIIPTIAAAQETGLPVGAKAPTSTMVETLDGKPFDMGQFVGKTPVLIEFWATWCPNCKQLEPAMAEAAKKYAGKI